MAELQSRTDVSGAELTPLEKSFLARLAVACLVISVVFAAGTVVWGVGFPTTLVAFLCGIALATLSYAFLGGVRGNQFSIGGLKLAGTAGTVAAIFYLMPRQLHTEMNDIERITAAEAKIAAVQEAADRARSTLIIDTGMEPQPIAGGGTVDLGYVRATEGDLSRLPRDDPESTLAALLRKAEISGVDAADLLAMSPGQYTRFLAELEESAARSVDKLNEIPFAELQITPSDGASYSQVVLSGGPPIPVTRRGTAEPEAYLCIRRILDVKESGSMEREVVVLSHSRGRCS